MIKTYGILKTIKIKIKLLQNIVPNFNINFSKILHQFQSKTKTLIRKLERILRKLNRQNLSLLFNQTC